MVENRWIGKQVIEQVIRFLRPDILEFDWDRDASVNIYSLSMTGGVRLEVDPHAVDQAADQEDALPALSREIEKALLESESGRRIGFISEVEVFPSRVRVR